MLLLTLKYRRMYLRNLVEVPCTSRPLLFFFFFSFNLLAQEDVKMYKATQGYLVGSIYI